MRGVPLQLAQKAMRHSTPVLTANAYTHLGRADIADAVNRTPSVVDTSATRNVAPNVAPTGGAGGHDLALSVIQQCIMVRLIRIAFRRCLSTVDAMRRWKEMVGGAGLEPATLCV